MPAPASRRRPKLGYAILAVAGAVVIGGAQMALSLASTQDSFTVAQLSAQNRSLQLQKQALHEELVGLSSPQSLASKADALGLVVAGSASYLRLSDGQVLGASQSASGVSTVDPDGPGSVGNALLAPPPQEQATPTDGTAQESGPVLPPAVAEGLPSPTTH